MSCFVHKLIRVIKNSSQFVGLHPLVCSLIAESHPLHKIVRLVWSPAVDTVREEVTKNDHAHDVFFMSSSGEILPSVNVRDGVFLLCLYLVEKGSEDSPGFLKLITGIERGAAQLKKKSQNTIQKTEQCLSPPTCVQSASDFHRRHPGSAARRHLGASHSGG